MHFRVALALLFCLSSLALAEDAKPAAKPEEKVVRTFVGTVEKIVNKSEFSGTVIRTDNDPRYVVVIRVVEDKGSLKAGETLAYFIHSPTQTFWRSGADEAKGQKFEFTETVSGALRVLDAKPIKE